MYIYKSVVKSSQPKVVLKSNQNLVRGKLGIIV